MTRKHFTAIAETLNKRISSIHTPTKIRREIEEIAIALADEFEAFNPHFNRSKFLAVALA